MQAQFVHDGDAIDYTPASAVVAGQVVVRNSLIAIAKLAIAANTLGALAVKGVFDVAKVTGAIDDGTKVYWDADGNPLDGTAGTGALTTDETLGKLAGVTVADAAETDTTARVKLLGTGGTQVAETQAASTAESAANAVIDLNLLIAKLKAAGIMASS